jgi:uncharacterized protein (TIGR02594 family)
MSTNNQSLLPPWALVALAELGQREIIGADANPRIAAYLKTVAQKADDEIPWCAAFVNWSLLQCGIKGTGLANAKSYLTWGAHTALRPGAIIIQNRGHQSWQGHVSIVVQVNSTGVYAIGGNQSNMVSIANVSKDLIVAARYPLV